MDISKASNFERYIFDIVGRDSARVVELWDSLKRTGEFMLTSEEWQRVRESGFYAARSTHADRIACIRDVWNKYSFVVDPHTADGINAARSFAGEGKILCLETALAAKFSETIEEALGFAPEIPAGYEGLLERPQKVTEIPADTKLVKELIKEAAR
jgi:threonine synthase